MQRREDERGLRMKTGRFDVSVYIQTAECRQCDRVTEKRKSRQHTG